ncbi:conserved hypothetical protein [Ricinus communis]|uniref:Uncharacterized protein n=1 Tax=Ricinus communis TaxID=3988 RepID=B9RL18_RICCO|nr:conserved hypothetical protein [Ricinus communis]
MAVKKKLSTCLLPTLEDKHHFTLWIGIHYPRHQRISSSPCDHDLASTSSLGTNIIRRLYKEKSETWSFCIDPKDYFNCKIGSKMNDKVLENLKAKLSNVQLALLKLKNISPTSIEKEKLRLNGLFSKEKEIVGGVEGKEVNDDRKYNFVPPGPLKFVGASTSNQPKGNISDEIVTLKLLKESAKNIENEMNKEKINMEDDGDEEVDEGANDKKDDVMTMI